MPPPLPPSSQGSRAGYITTIVIFFLMWATTTFLAFKFHAERDAEQELHRSEVLKYQPAVTLKVLAADDEVKQVIEDARDIKKNPTPSTGIQEAIRQRDMVSTLVTGVPASVEAVKNSIENTLASVKPKMTGEDGTPLYKGNDLLGNLEASASEIGVLKDRIKVEQGKTGNAEKANIALIAAQDAKLKEKDDAIAKLGDEAKAYQDKLAEMEKTRDTNQAAQNDSAKKETLKAQESANIATADKTKVDTDYKKLKNLYDTIVIQLAKYRVNPSRSLLQPAGLVTRVPGNNIAFINLGEGKQISPGLTFEVYDRKKGVPSLITPNPDDKDALPVGKGSIEVIRILPDTCECRIIREEKGQHIAEGDLILNLIYNTHTKFNFVVYGDFDLSGTGNANAAEGETLRRLAREWGARVMDGVNAETDFLVLGKQPLPPEPGEATDAVGTEKKDKQQKIYDNYMKLVETANKFSVPILNQNRFLYFIGYYDQKSR